MNTSSALARFTITLSTAVSEPVQVEWYTSDGTAKASVDYAANKGIVVFSPGETAKTVDILVYGRAVGTEDRSFYVEMLPPTNAILGASIGECIIHVDTTGSTPVTQIIIPTGPQGIQGKSAYQSYVDTTTDNPPMTEPEWVESLKGDPEEIAQEVAPLIDVGDTTLISEGTDTLSKPDSTTVKAVARRIAYAAPAKIATVTLADGDNSVGQADMTGDTLDMSSETLYPRIMRGSSVITPEWSIQPDGDILVKNAVAGDVLYVCQYDFISGKKSNTNTRELWRRSLAEAGIDLVTGSFEGGSTVEKVSDAIWHIAGGQCYSWGGTFPKAVPVGSTPSSTGGEGPGAWLSVGDATLRSDLSKESGAILIDGGSIIEFKKEFYFAVGGTVTSNRDAVKHTDGFWYIWGGTYPKTIGSSTPDTDNNWKCVGLLNGYAVNDAQNFGFTSGMNDALPALNAMIRSPFFKMFFPPESAINVSSDWMLSRSSLDIDFHASTINWTGGVFSSTDVANGSEMAILNTPNFVGGTAGSLKNIHLSNLNIKANDYSIGVSLRNTTNFSIKNVYVEKSQRQGINVTNCHNGGISQITLKDCAPLSDKGFTSDQLEAWGDGLIIWYGSTNVSVDNIIVESGSNSRGGRCGICVDGYAPPGKPDTRIISINNAYVYGYDRPVHTELCGVVTVSNSVFEYNSGSDTHHFLQCAVVVWNVHETTTFINSTFRTDMRFMKNSGAKAKFIKCNVYKNSSTENMFVPGIEQTGEVAFDDCLISQTGGKWAAWNCSLSFNNCYISSDSAGAVIDFGSESTPKTLQLVDTFLSNTLISAKFAPKFTKINISNSSISGDVNCGPSARLTVDSSNIYGAVTCNSMMRYNGQKPNKLNYIQNSDQQYNGFWLGSGKPSGGRPDGSGDWSRGDVVLNLDAVESTPFQWYCVTPGSPGRWSVSGTLGVGS